MLQLRFTLRCESTDLASLLLISRSLSSCTCRLQANGGLHLLPTGYHRQCLDTHGMHLHDVTWTVPVAGDMCSSPYALSPGLYISPPPPSILFPSSTILNPDPNLVASSYIDIDQKISSKISDHPYSHDIPSPEVMITTVTNTFRL